MNKGNFTKYYYSFFIYFYCCVFSIQITYAQNFYLGSGYGRNSMKMEVSNADTRKMGFNSYSLCGGFQKGRLLLEINSELGITNIDLNEGMNYYYSYSHGSSSGQYSITRSHKTLIFENRVNSLYNTLNVAGTFGEKKQVLFFVGGGIGHTFPIHQEILKDSLIKYEYNEYSNQPAGIYSETETYEYSNSSETDLKLTLKRYYFTPFIGLLFKSKNERFIGNLKIGILRFLSPLLQLTNNQQGGSSYYEINHSTYIKLFIGYNLSGLKTKE